MELPRFAIEVAAQHRLYSEGAGSILDLATMDLPTLTGWLAGRVGFPVKAPRALRPGRQVVGGGVGSVGDTMAAYLLYEWGGHRISLFVMPLPPDRSEWGERVIDGVELYTATINRITVTWWKDGQLLYVAASAAAPADLDEFALLCVRSGGLGGARMPPREIRDA